MKRIGLVLCVVGLIGLALIFAGIVKAAQGPAVVDSPRLISFNAIPLYDENSGALMSLTVTFAYRVPMLLPDGKAVRPHIRTEKADFVLQGGQLVIIGNQLVEFGDLAEDILAVADFVWKLNNPNILPTNPPAPLERRKKIPSEKRKTLREP